MNKVFKQTKSFVSIEGRVLAKALQPLAFVVERRNTMPILGMVKLALDGPVLTISGTDLDIETSIALDVIDGTGKWAICIGARLLASIARQAGPAEIRIEVSQRASVGRKGEPINVPSAVVTVGDNVTYDLDGVMSAETFPTMAWERGSLVEKFGNGSFAAMVEKVSWCISTEETRYYLNGVCWQVGPLGRRFIATDGHKLAMCRYDADVTKDKVDRIIPRKTVSVLRRFASGQDVTVYSRAKATDAGVTEDTLTGLEFVLGRMTIRTKLIEGTFPDVDRVVPAADKQVYHFDINRAELLTAIDQVMVLTSPHGGRAVSFSGGPDQPVTVATTSSDGGSARVRLSSSWPLAGKEPAPDFGFNGAYLKDLLLHCEGNIIVHQIDAGSPFAVADGDETMTRLIMPMRV